MFSIVAAHCAGGLWGAVNKVGSPFLASVEDWMKFGSIAFFLVSGFLLGSRFETASRTAFLGKRLNKVFLPWLFWFFVQVIYYGFGRVEFHGQHFGFDLETLSFLVVVVKTTAFATAFWFVPNLLLAIVTLLIFRRFLRRTWFGLTLFAITCFYSVNIYTNWVPSSHTMALFGFVFYLWLGAWASRNFQWVSQRIARVSTPLVLLSIAVTFAASLAETRLLTHLHSMDATNSIRVTNQLYSFAVVMLMMKFKSEVTPSFVEVRKNMFGVYLTLTLVLSVFETATKRLLPHVPGSGFVRTDAGFLVLWVLGTAVVFTACLGISKLFSQFAVLSWAVGDRVATPYALSERRQHDPSSSHLGASSLQKVEAIKRANVA